MSTQFSIYYQFCQNKIRHNPFIIMNINHLIYVSYIKNLNSGKILTNTFPCLDGKMQGTDLAATPGIPFFQHVFPDDSLIQISNPPCVFPYKVISTGLPCGRVINTAQDPNGGRDRIVIYSSEAAIKSNMAVPEGGSPVIAKEEEVLSARTRTILPEPVPVTSSGTARRNPVGNG